MEAKELVKYFKSLGLEVHTATKARGHQGFFLKNRIDISKNIPENRKIPTLLHEFAHYIHSKIEPGMEKTGGTFNGIFQNDNKIIDKELLNVTHFIDKNSLCEKLEQHKNIVKKHIKEQEQIIKTEYPEFLRTKKFKEFDKYIKKSDAKYLLKYDRIKIVRGFLKKSSKIYTIETIEQDFTNMPKAKVGVIIPDAWMTETYANAVVEICKYWGVPVLNMKGDPNVPMRIGGKFYEVSSAAKTAKDNYFKEAPDNGHPNVKAHEYSSTYIEDFLRRL